MEEDLLTSAVTDQDGVEVDDFIYNDGTSFGGERCGICMDIIIDRGVLDCCQHWFCFGCIDNWATITNLCPLCQNEFQLITCVPVYDTIGSSKNDDDSYSSRDDDWFVEGKNNTLSFPSYYIDENAVICLDGDGCKIRNGLAATEGDSNLDTSIACDSCDLWYHAFCVGFDPESTSENTWLCPRCVVDEMPQKSDGNLGKNYNNLPGSEDSNRGLNYHLVEDTYSRKMSVSVADSGETALVVSMVEGDKLTEEPLDNIGQAVEVNKDLKTQAFMLTSKDDGQKQITPSEEKSVPILKTRELELSLSCDTSLSVSSNCLIKKELVTSADKSVNDHSSSFGIKSSEEFSNELCISNNPSGGSSDMGLRLCLSVGSFLSEVNKSVTEDQMNEGLDQPDPLEECKPTAEKYVPEADEDVPVTSGVKRKHWDYSSNIRDDTHASDNEDSKTEIENEATPKKMRADERTRPISPIDQVNISASNDSNIASLEQNNGTADIMSIVQGTKRRPSKGPKRTSTGDEPSKEVENSGLRVKKIMKRATEEDKESSTVVQNLRKQIREAVRNNKSVKEVGEENLFDPKLLAAFRAAVSGPKTEPNKALSQLGFKARKSMLQKGKVRENLTKKIYKSSNGRRKRAWDRDCEVEFWKHRCLRASRPEKIQTLESVLDLLRNGSEGTENGQRSKDPILSRLYLADTSVFPRKDDIKPLAALKTSGDSEPSNNKQNEKRLKASLDSSNSQVIDSSKVEKKSLKSVTREEKIVKPPDVKVDKRKWALEVLARRAGGGAGDRSASERNEDNAVLNGNYPLLAQLPVEMRPVLAVSRHNKIPMSVRQVQLYRLTEHLLRKANLPEIRRNAETELAVADAINIEREVSDRSNSKPVYINLCAQELVLHRSETTKPREEDPQPVENDPEQPGTELATGPTVEEALRNAGLVSDSPPNSPENEGPDDVFEIDNAPDLDIFGEFEYSLDEEDYIGNSSTLQVSKAQQNLEECGSKLKLVFSTLGSEKPESELPNSVEPRVPEEGSLSLLGKEGEEVSIAECEELYGPDKEPLEPLSENLIVDESMKLGGLGDEKSGTVGRNSFAEESSPNRSEMVENARKKVEKKSSVDNSISKKVEAYVKEHVRPLCKSGIITADQYRWAVAKTTEKVMKYHSKAKNANFLIKEGEKVKRLSEQYVEAAKQKDKTD